MSSSFSTFLTSAPPITGELPKLWYYARPKVALEKLNLAISLGRIALFGPRQTGKTSMLCVELVPLAIERGMLPVYIECWADKTDVMGSILYALQKALDDLRIPPKGLARTGATKLRKLGFAGGSIELGEVDKRSKPVSKYLQVDALLTELIRETSKPLLLIFDEFQVLAASPDAENAAAAIRSALTQAAKRVSVIFSGSSQIELMQTFSRAKAPLYGFANPEPYPLLGRAFVEHVAKKFNQACKRSLDIDQGVALLEQLGAQPEAFLTAINYMLASPKLTMTNAAKAMLEPTHQSRWTVNWTTLSDAEKATLLLLFDERAPTSRESLDWVKAFTARDKIGAAAVTRALDALILRGLIERDVLGGRGKYLIVDPVMHAWLRHNRASMLL